MKLEQAYITEQGLSAEQVTSLETVTDANEATLKQGWDGKANEEAEKIIQGAIDLSVTKMGIEGVARTQGEKMGEFLMRATPLYIDSALAKEKLDLSTKQKELEDKIKAGGDEAVKTELGELKVKFDLLQQKEAKFKDYEENDYKGKYEELLTTVATTTEAIAFKDAMPNFPDTVNEYEAKAKYAAFKAGVKEKYIIQQDKEGNIVLTSKDNEHVKTDLDTLVKADKTITELAAGRSLKGPGKDSKEVKIEGLPFTIKPDATSSERREAIVNHLTTVEKLNTTSKGYADKFAQYNQLILKQKNA